MDIASHAKSTFCLLAAVILIAWPARAQTTNDFRKILAQAVVTEDADAQIDLIKQLVGSSDELVSRGLAAWRLSELYVHTARPRAFASAMGSSSRTLLAIQCFFRRPN